MWDLFSRKVKFTAISVLTLMFVIAYLALGKSLPLMPQDMDGLLTYSKFVSYLTTYWIVVFLAIKLFGMHAWRVPGLAHLLNNYVGPDLRGGWKSTVTYIGDDGQAKSKQLNFVINMSIFDFSMSMNSEDGYSSSHVVSSKLLRDELLGGFVLYYVFESEVSNPVSKDVANFQGAAKLRVNSSGPLKGVYWTNRNWQNRLQTAGHVELTRT